MNAGDSENETGHAEGDCSRIEIDLSLFRKRARELHEHHQAGARRHRHDRVAGGHLRPIDDERST
jgi:hypothetical protein